MNFLKRIIFKIKAFFWKRKINKMFGYKSGYKYGKLTRNYDFSSAYPFIYADTDSIKR